MSQQFYDIISMVILALGGAILLIAIIGDAFKQRINGKRRCPKCWYDLSHTQGLICSECGYTAKHEHKLYKSRRRWRLVWLAFVIFIASHGFRVIPAVKVQGWIAAVPTTALIAVLPFLEPDLDVVIGVRQSWMFDSVLPPKLNWRDILYLNLLERCDDEELLWSWQASLLRYVSNFSIDDPEFGKWRWDELWEQVAAGTKWRDNRKILWSDLSGNLDIDITTRPVWPVGSRIYASFETANYNIQYQIKGYGITDGLIGFQREEFQLSRYAYSPPSLWDDGLEFIGQLANEQNNLQYTFSLWDEQYSPELSISRWEISWDKPIQLPMSVQDSVNSILKPVSSEDLTNALAKLVDAQIVNQIYWKEAGKVYALTLGIDDDKLEELLHLIPETTFAYRAEVYCGDKLVAQGEAWHKLHHLSAEHSYDYIALPYPEHVKLTIIDEETLTNPNNDQPFTLRLIGDPYVALRNFDCDQYWEGEVTVPLTVNIN